MAKKPKPPSKPPRPPSKPKGYGWVVLAFVSTFAIAMLTACHTYAEGTTSKSKIKAQQPWSPPPYQPPVEVPSPEAVAMHNFYVGAVGGFAWDTPTFEDFRDQWEGGLVAGYLFRPNSVLGLGIEADYVARHFGIFSGDGVASLRGRLGVFIGQSFLYGTAGIHETWSDAVPDDLRRGLVVGGGIEREVGKHVLLRLEALHYRVGDDYLSWGDDGSTKLRAGLLYKF